MHSIMGETDTAIHLKGNILSFIINTDTSGNVVLIKLIAHKYCNEDCHHGSQTTDTQTLV